MLHLAQNIRWIRILKGDTQPQFAKRLGIPGITNDIVSAWERGVTMPNDLVIKRVANIAGITENELKSSDLRDKNIELLNPDNNQVEFKITPNGVNQQEVDHLRQLLREKDELLKEKDERIKLLTKLVETTKEKS